MFTNDTHSCAKHAVHTYIVHMRTVFIGVCFLLLGAFNAFAEETAEIAKLNAPDINTTGSNIEGFGLAGNPEADELFSQAKTYHDGTGVDVDLRKALALYTLAADLGNIDARINLGYMYFVGEGVAQNYGTARKYYLVAANAGDTVAQKNLGAMYEHGLGVTANMKTAQKWYDKSEGKRPPAKTVKTIPTPPKPTPAVKVKTKAPVEPTIFLQGPPFVDSLSGIENLRGEVVERPPVLTPTSRLIETAPTSTMPSNTKTTPIWARTIERQGSIWTRYVISATLLSIAVIGAIWYIWQLRIIKRTQQQYQFAANFYASHRESLRGSYLRTPENLRMFLYPRDPWAVSVCALMVRFATYRHADPQIQCKTSANIARALNDTPYAARLETFPLVSLIQERLFADIRYLNKETIHPPKPFQFSHTKFLSKTKGKILGNTRPASLRLVK